jgi:hypothetical protein
MCTSTAVRLIVNGVELAANALELTCRSDLTVTEKVDRVSKCAMNALAIGSAASAALECPTKVQEGFITAEIIGTTLNLPLQVTAFLAQAGQHEELTWLHVGRLIEIAGEHMAKFIRLSAELGCPQEREYLAMSDEERAKAKRPVYRLVEDCENGHYEYAGDKPVDKAECERNLRRNESTARTAETVELVAAYRLPTTAAGLIVLAATFVQIFDRIYRERREQERGVGAAFLERETIPEEFEVDEILSQYICPITRSPIRHPVTDPTSRTMYERAAIEEWIDRHHTSPLSRAPLERAQLVPDREAQERIDNRLRELQEQRDSVAHDLQELLAARQVEREENRGSENLPATEEGHEAPQQEHTNDGAPREGSSPSTQTNQQPNK